MTSPKTTTRAKNYVNRARVATATQNYEKHWRVYNKSEHRMTFEGILYRLRTGIPWRDLPIELGDWSGVYRRFNLWSKKGILNQLFKHLSKDADFDWIFADGSTVRAHRIVQVLQHKIVSALVKVEVETQQRFIWSSIVVAYLFTLNYQKDRDMTHVESLVEHLNKVSIFIADKDYDSASQQDYVASKGG
ncbi:hypothetical protein GCM10007916_28760 [Psychromonas marina]|uniref:Insertion element IS402-like domain-containing protein n=1 Tax=Psychromonas marina TaxID=88364 RepID=A0ABQ6E389_9GAMM|nr:hypothetical protein GCM10007916_28760 [Psychromonas marina]